MSAPRETTPGAFESPNGKPKDVVLCEGTLAPLTIPTTLIGRIWEQVNQSLHTAPPEAAEVGGLLLGCRTDSSGILVEALEPISGEHRFGAFRICATDAKGIEALMASVQEDPSRAVVGFYRSRIRNDSLPADNDSTILAALEQSHRSFDTDFRYFIVFTPLSKLRMTVSASFRTDGGWAEWQHVTLVMNSPAASTFAEQTARQAALPHSEAAPVRPQPSSEELRRPGPKLRDLVKTAESRWPHPHGDERVRRTWMYLTSTALLAAVSVGLYWRSHPAKPRVGLRETTSSAALPDFHLASVPAAIDTTRPRLWASREGAVWKVTWNRYAVEALNPGAALLSIRDGDAERNIELAPSILSSGAIFYVPQSENLLFRLKVAPKGGPSAEEHVRVIQGQIVEAPEESISQITDPETHRTSPKSALTSDEFAVVPSQPKANRPPRRIASRPISASASRSARHRPPATKPTPVAAPRAATPKGLPLFASLPPPSVTLPPEPSVTLPSSDTTCCTATATYEPAGPSGVQRVLHKIPVVRKLTLGRASSSKGFIPPRPIHDLEFALPPAASPALMETKKMDLKAEVDASGQVTRVKLLSPRDQGLATLTAYAAKRWRFEPAQWNEEPVPAEVILHFRFDGSAAALTEMKQSQR